MAARNYNDQWICPSCTLLDGSNFICNDCEKPKPKPKSKPVSKPVSNNRPIFYKSDIPFNKRVRTYSRFFMPMITEAWYRAQNMDIPEEILGFGYEVIATSGINDAQYNDYVRKIQRQLQRMVYKRQVSYDTIQNIWYSKFDQTGFFSENDTSLRHNSWHKSKAKGDKKNTPGHIHAVRQFQILGRKLEDEIVKALDFPNNPNMNKFGGKKTKKTKKTKKVRKHKGITQTGGNKGKLRKGYRYSGKKLKNGLSQIIKCKNDFL